MPHKLGLVMIVKDEEINIRKCLSSAILAGVTIVTILDTGSTDGTPEIIKEICADIELCLHFSKFVNFGQARSEAFKLAQYSAEWLLDLDADMTVSIAPEFKPNPLIDAYMLELRDSGTSWRVPRLLRGDLPWKSVGACHEYTALSDKTYKTETTDLVKISFTSTTYGPVKRHWYAGLLEEELLREPENPRTVFYLAQTYQELGDPRARELYQRRAAMGGFEEEAWFSLYRAAVLAEWPQKAVELLAAWERRPTRLEPLHVLVSELNKRDLHKAAYELTSIAITPSKDVLFVQTDAWEWGILFERSIAAWWVGKKEEAYALGDELLKKTNLPLDIRQAIERNRRL
jgi:glycosyltransferase involved in cell wall biosynthesis